MASEQEKEGGVGRRGFLGAVAGLTAGAALAAPGLVGSAKAETGREDRKRARYRETDHVLRFYETNRY